MPPLKVLEVVFAAGAAEQQPVSVRPANTTAEGDIQAPRNLVDEIIHVSLMPAVVVAREQHPALVVNEHPAGKMNRLHAGKVAARKYVAGRELNDCQDERNEGTSKRTRFRRAERRVLVRDIVIFQALQFDQEG